METVMGAQARREYVRTQRRRYQDGTREEKKRILDEGCKMFGVHRKSLIRGFGRSEKRPRRSRGRPQKFGPEVVRPLREIWKNGEQACGKRLKAMLPIWLPHYERHYGALDKAVRAKLLLISASTIDRLLRPLRAQCRKGLCGTRSVNRLKGQIPIRTNFRDVDGPGFVEADTVAHGGESTAGSFVWTLTLTDIWSGWTENRSVWNKSAKQIVLRLRDIEENLAFDIVAFDSDNGGEFINHVLYRYFHNRATRVSLSRSRPSHKNDQAHVEQKQWTHVRQLLGYQRFADRRLVEPVNDLLRTEWRLKQNFFLPTMQLISKTREGAKIHRRHGKPSTPCQRLLNSPKVSEEAKEKLRREFEALDPFDLNQKIEAKLAPIFRMVRASQKGATPKRQKSTTASGRQKTATKARVAA